MNSVEDVARKSVFGPAAGSRGFLRLSSWLALFGFLLVSSSACSQIIAPGTAQSLPIPNAGHDYIGLGSETVNPADGSVSFNLPIKTPGGRQLSFPFSISANTASPFILVNGGASQFFRWSTSILENQREPFSENGWSYMLPYYEAQATARSLSIAGTSNYCWTTDNFIFSGFDGRLTPISIQNQWADGGNANPTAGCGKTVYPASGQGPGGYIAQLSAPPVGTIGIQPPLDIIDKSGTDYSFPLGPGISTNPGYVANGLTPFGLLAQTITDRNGNQISLQGTSVYGARSVLGAGSYKDTLGRTAVAWSGLGAATGDHITVSGFGGDIVVKWTTASVTLPQTIRNVYGSTCSFVPNAGPLSIAVVSEIDLPNSTKYSFEYGGTWGLLSNISFPDGGYVRYVWGTNPSSQIQSLSWTIQAPETCEVMLDSPAITDRYVSFDGVSETFHQTFNGYATDWTQPSGFFFPYWSGKHTVVTDSQMEGSNWVTVAVTKYDYAGTIFPGPAGLPLEHTVTYQDGAGKTLRTVNKSWMDPYTAIGEQTVLDSGQGITKLHCPNQDGLDLATFEYTYQNAGAKPADPPCSALGTAATLSSGLNTAAIGPLLRKTATVYHNFGASHIDDAPDSMTVMDASGNVVAQTTFAYDGSAVGVTGTQVGVGAARSQRGNPTTISRWVSNTSGSVSKTLSYWDTGQIASVTDECGSTACPDLSGTNHTTNFSYLDHWASGTTSGQTHAYLTSTTDALGHQKSYTYNANTGELATATDPNGNTTTYTYNDSLARLTGVDEPPSAQNGGVRPHTAYSYTDGAGAGMQVQGPSGITTQKRFDGFDRVIQSALTSDPQGAVYVDTVYDGSGNIHSVSNPHRSTSNPSDGITTYGYDALHRMTLQQQPDGSAKQWSYGGNTVVTIDEVGHSWSRNYDGLWRLGNVTEPNGASTGYVYDLLDNLTIATQIGVTGEAWRNHSFSYDALSRLHSTTNPETGTETYTYDANSNVQSKTDARGITTSYGYDALNRLTRKTYTDGTPTTLYVYDTNQIFFSNTQRFTTSNVLGRLSVICVDIPGTCQSMTAYSYDPAGRFRHLPVLRVTRPPGQFTQHPRATI